uniref:Uncharacterized protein n=1 Tax=Strombidinopsis acuminata TaxID=141414 RepID=A0A7S3UA79_9SPIT
MAPAATSKPAAARKRPEGGYTKSARDLQAKERVAILDDVRKESSRAVEHCRATGESARRALQSGNFPLATKGKVRQALAKKSADAKGMRDHHSQLLTNDDDAP